MASQGATVEEATANLKEAVELFLECADPEEIEQRLHSEIFVTRFEANGYASSSFRQRVGLEAHGFTQIRQRASHIVMQQKGEDTTDTVLSPRGPHKLLNPICYTL